MGAWRGPAAVDLVLEGRASTVEDTVRTLRLAERGVTDAVVICGPA
jgi:hypothetical protein